MYSNISSSAADIRLRFQCKVYAGDHQQRHVREAQLFRSEPLVRHGVEAFLIFEVIVARKQHRIPGFEVGNVT